MHHYILILVPRAFKSSLNLSLMTNTFPGPVTLLHNAVLVAESWPTLYDPMDCSPQDTSVSGILQERILEWVAIPFYRGSSPRRDRTWVSTFACRFFTMSH